MGPGQSAAAAKTALGLLGSSATRHATWVKSNAAGLAAAVTARARPDDVVVIAPEWIASSFNYYFTAPNRQIVFPSLRRIEMPEWNSPFGRISDPAALAAARDTISAIHARGGRIWLIEESRWAERDVPDWWEELAITDLYTLHEYQDEEPYEPSETVKRMNEEEGRRKRQK